MYHTAYKYDIPVVNRYVFTSVGRKRIEKVVEFSGIGLKDTFNLGFGDLLPDGRIDDLANSNNGDIVKVLVTVIDIIKDFTNKNPHAHIFFTGSTKERTNLYSRILRTYYSSFIQEFRIYGFLKIGGKYKEFPFDPAMTQDYPFYLIKRIF
jgi:hypothetical protein